MTMTVPPPAPTVHPINLGLISCYLVKGTDGYLLIDTAYPKAYRKFRARLKKFGLPLSAIKYLLLTHHHDDHAGFAAQLIEETGCKLIVHRSGLPYLARGAPEELGRPVNDCIKRVFGFFSFFHGPFTFPPVEVKGTDIILDGNETWSLNDIGIEIGIDGEIISTPGHTKDSLSVVLADGSAFVGDAAVNFLNFCRVQYRPIFIQDMAVVVASWQRLLDSGATRIYPAHGPPFDADELKRVVKEDRR